MALSDMQTQQDGPDVKRTLLWLRWADTDYRAARLTLRAGLLVQGATLSNTAIEKYLKSLFSHRNLTIPRSHEVSALYSRIKRETGSNLSINESYLRLLEKAYELRYPDDVTDGFNIALNEVRLLAELDRTVKKITERFEIVQMDTNHRIPLIIERAIQDKDQVILAHNVALNNQITDSLFSHPSRSFDFRRHKGRSFETEYVSESVKDEPDYDVEGFKVVSDNQFTAAYRPILESPNSASVDGLQQRRVAKPI